MIDNTDLNSILEKLEGIEDEELAVQLLKQFNDLTKVLGQLIINKDEELSNAEWKTQCDDAKNAVDECVSHIMSL